MQLRVTEKGSQGTGAAPWLFFFLSDTHSRTYWISVNRGRGVWRIKSYWHRYLTMHYNQEKLCISHLKFFAYELVFSKTYINNLKAAQCRFTNWQMCRDTFYNKCTVSQVASLAKGQRCKETFQLFVSSCSTFPPHIRVKLNFHFPQFTFSCFAWRYNAVSAHSPFQCRRLLPFITVVNIMFPKNKLQPLSSLAKTNIAL